MKQFTKRENLISHLTNLTNQTIGFVPTMGALHSGHISLVELARKQCDQVVVSIFVNPTQFNDKNDLKNYPRTESKDLALLEAAGVDVVFTPTVDQIYAEPDLRVFDFGTIDKVMEGATRPGHFNGVAQVVSKLFDIVRPTKAFFGEKDFQQIAVIRAMVAQLGFDLEIVDCPIKRDVDGLALSSRNALLEPEYRKTAPLIYKTLQEASKMVSSNTPAQIETWATEQINCSGLLKTIYFNIVDSTTLLKIDAWDDTQKAQACVAVQAGSVRLIDNISLLCK